MKYLNYALIVIGGFIAMYAKVAADQNQLILMLGIVLLMIGVYRISKNIPSKEQRDNDEHPEN